MNLVVLCWRGQVQYGLPQRLLPPLLLVHVSVTVKSFDIPSFSGTDGGREGPRH